MKYVLGLADSGLDLLHGCSGQSEHGGRASTIYALRRKGLINGDAITDAGKAVLLKTKEKG